ncbi:MAG: hypothetical protein P4L41_03460 [Flavipsychrobacter sp.]|nr:hypothetical protein [Flavipsychrobacter sp.]
MAYKNGDWYQHLVDQSRTDHIYDLVREYLQEDWTPGHLHEFVVVRSSMLPENLGKTVPEQHLGRGIRQEDYSFPAHDYVLLNNNYLTEYLEAAMEMVIIEDFDNRSFIELLFTNTVGSDKQTGDEEEEPDVLAKAYDLLRKGESRKLALQYAMEAEGVLDGKLLGLDKEVDAAEILRVKTGYNIIATVFAWNDKIDEAAVMDNKYLYDPALWALMKRHISSYLELLIAKKEEEYLQFIFEDATFKMQFLPHYEVFTSLFIDDTHVLTRRQEALSIINIVNNYPQQFL